MTSAAPIGSSTQTPGTIPNTASANGDAANQFTHSDWVNAFVDYWASRWANGDHTVPDGWVSASFGEPDGNDVNGLASARTLLAFAKYAQAYHPGMDAGVDQWMPWIPPGPNDFIETPEQAAARVSQANWQADFDAKQKQQDIQNGIAQGTLTLQQQQLREQQYEAQLKQFQDAFTNQLNAYNTQAGIYGTQVQSADSLFNTKAGIYNANEGNRLSALGQAGSLAGALQQVYDARTNNAIQLQAHPDDMVQREYAVRALQAPQGTTQPGYQNVDALGEVIKRLINFTPGQQPAEPTLPAAPTAPVQTDTAPTAPTLSMGITTDQATHPAATTPLPIQHTVQGLASGATNVPSPPTSGDHAGEQGMTIGGVWYPLQSGTPAMADGGTTGADSFIAGDEQVPGESNPEHVQIDYANRRASVTPIRRAPLMRAQRMAARGRQRPGTLASALGGIRAYAMGTDNPPNVNLTSYPDSVYQNFPSLRYIQGNIARPNYNTLATGMTGGAFGTQIPEAGSINYRNYLDIARRPDSLAALGSLYSAGNRDLASEVAAAKARAPFGQAISTSLVRS